MSSGERTIFLHISFTLGAFSRNWGETSLLLYSAIIHPWTPQIGTILVLIPESGRITANSPEFDVTEVKMLFGLNNYSDTPSLELVLRQGRGRGLGLNRHHRTSLGIINF